MTTEHTSVTPGACWATAPLHRLHLILSFAQGKTRWRLEPDTEVGLNKKSLFTTIHHGLLVKVEIISKVGHGSEVLLNDDRQDVTQIRVGVKDGPFHCFT